VFYDRRSAGALLAQHLSMENMPIVFRIARGGGKRETVRKREQPYHTNQPKIRLRAGQGRKRAH